MKTSAIVNWHAAASQYEDLEVVVTTDTGHEYLFIVTLDREDRSISDADVVYAPSTNDDYVPFEGPIPDDVAAAFAAIRPEMVKQLESL